MLRKYLETQLAEHGDSAQPVQGIKKLQGEASNRVFYRVYYRSFSSVAMVYPEPAAGEIDRICRLSAVYRKHGLEVPEIRGVFGNRVIVQEDLGDLLVQRAFSRGTPAEKDAVIETVADILVTLNNIDRSHTAAILDTTRMKWEMDFFITHFASHFLPGAQIGGRLELLREQLHRLAEAIAPMDTFAHRDFHCRNMLMRNNVIYLVDFQDSLVGPAYYDLVSFGFDAYLDLNRRRESLLESLKQRGVAIDEEQYYLTALQRNIKALGTFGYQVTVRRKLSYKKYIDRTIRHIKTNPLFQQFFKPGQFDWEPHVESRKN